VLYASDAHGPRHQRARELLERLAAGPDLVYIFWPVAMTHLRIATHPGIFEDPLSPKDARANVAGLLARPHVRCPGEGPGFWPVFKDTVEHDVVRGNLVTDAHIAALMRQHGVGSMWTADRGFLRFPAITVRDPYAETRSD
jgi:toxin-antitoxin system PIN domain toxin